MPGFTRKARRFQGLIWRKRCFNSARGILLSLQFLFSSRIENTAKINVFQQCKSLYNINTFNNNIKIFYNNIIFYYNYVGEMWKIDEKIFSSPFFPIGRFGIKFLQRLIVFLAMSVRSCSPGPEPLKVVTPVEDLDIVNPLLVGLPSHAPWHPWSLDN